MKLAVRFFESRAAVAGDSEAVARRYIGFLALAFVGIFGLVWLYTASLPMAFLSRDYPAWLAKRSMIESCDLGQVAVFGDSRTMAGIEPNLLPLGGANLAFSGSSPIEAYFAVQRMLLCKTLPKTVVLAFSVGGFMSDTNYWRSSARVGIVNFAAMRDVQRESRRLHDDEMLHLTDGEHLTPLLSEALMAARFPSFYFGSLIDGFGFGRYLYNKRMEGKILSARGEALFGTDAGSHDLASETELSHFTPSPVVNYYFRSILAEMAKRDVPVVLLSMPINDATCQVMDPSLRPALLAYLHQAIAADPRATMVGPTMPCWPNRFFGDGFHLNAAGAERYTATVARWLQPAEPQSAAAAALVVER